MASLALAAAVVILSIWFIAALSLFFSFLGFKLLGMIFGVLSTTAGIWLLITLPHAPFLAAINLIAGAVSIRRYFLKK